MITALLIDVDNTLLDFDKCAESSIKTACEYYHIPFTDKTFPTFTRINDGLWLKVESGEIIQPQLYARRFNDIFNILGIDFDGPTFEKKFKEYLHDSCVHVDNALDTLKYLKNTGKYYIAFSTNGKAEQQINRVRLAGFNGLFDDIFPSSEIGAEKPSEEYFKYCMEHIPCEDRNQVMIIGDSLTADIIGAKEFGLKTCWFNKKNIDKTCPQADYTIKSLSEIKNIL